MRATGARTLSAMAVAGALTLGAVPPGSATDATTLSVSASPNPGPALRPVNVEASGHAAGRIDVYGTYKPLSQTTECAATPGADAGTTVIDSAGLSGAYDARSFYSPSLPAGSYLICAWAEGAGADKSSTPLAASSSTLRALPPRVSLTLTATHRVPFGGLSQATVRWASNGPIELWLDSRRADAGGCAPRRGQEPRSAVDHLSGGTPDVPYATVGPAQSPGTNSLSGIVRARVGAPHPGRYRVCAYAQELVPVGDMGRPENTVALAPVRTTTFLEAGPLVFRGRTTQGKRVHFVDTTGSLTKFTFGIVYVCNDPRHTRFPLGLSNGASPVAVRRGKFHLVTQGVRISGRIRGQRAAGTAGPLSYKTNGYVCTMPRVRWSARAS